MTTLTELNALTGRTTGMVHTELDDLQGATLNEIDARERKV